MPASLWASLNHADSPRSPSNSIKSATVISAPCLGHPVFVTEIRPETNEVVIGENEDVFSNRLTCRNLNWMAIEDLDDQEMRVSAKIRYSHKGACCTIRKIGEDRVECVFDEPQRAATPGQAVVFYDGEYVVGGGTIE